jgi:hypothetical protein
MHPSGPKVTPISKRTNEKFKRDQLGRKGASTPLSALSVEDFVSDPAQKDGPPAPAKKHEPSADELEAQVQQALALCGGDPMQALRATLSLNAYLEAEVDRLVQVASSGFARGRLRTSRDGGGEPAG